MWNHLNETTYSSGNQLSISNKIDQQACIQVEINCNSSEDGYGSKSSDYHRELEQNTSGISVSVMEVDILTQDSDNDELSDIEEDDHRLLQQQHSSIAEVKVATGDMKGIHAQTGASVDMSTKGSSTTAGQVELKGADVDIKATAEPTVQGAFIQTGTATITGVQERIKVDVKATVSGTKVQAADVSGIKFGATAEASVEVASLDVKVDTAQVSAIEASATASASASTEAKISIGSARVAGFDGIGASASVSTQSQTELLNVQIGILSSHTGIQVSNTTTVGYPLLIPGPPKVGISKKHF